MSPHCRALRSDLQVRELDDEMVEVRDPITKRQFRFDAVQWDVARMIAAGRSLGEIAAELSDDPAVVSTVEQFANMIAQAGFFASESLDATDLGKRQALLLRPAAGARRDRAVATSVEWAATNLPFFRTHLGELGKRVECYADLRALPEMTKTDFRDNFPARLLPEGIDLNDLVARGEAQLATNSGSTGGRLAFVRDNNRDVVTARMPGVEMLGDGWGAARIARFTTPLCSGAVCHLGDVPFEQRIMDDTLHVASSERVMRLQRRDVDNIVRDLVGYGANVFQVDPVYAVALVRAMQRFGVPVPTFSAVLSFFEYLSVLHKPILEEAFQAPVTDFLSAADLGGGIAAFSCRNGRFHVNEHENVFELVRDDGEPARPGELAHILVTSLNHRFTRMIRYRLGDLGRPVDVCGCTYDDLPAFEFEGRAQECLRDTRGGRVTTRGVDQMFAGLNWIDFFQLTQRTTTRFELLVIRRPGVAENDDPAVFLERAKRLFGNDAEIVIEQARELPTQASFKFPLTKSLL